MLPQHRRLFDAAMAKGDAARVKVLISKGKVAVNELLFSSPRLIPITYAITLKDVKLVETLLALDADVTITDNIGRNSLHFAAMTGDE